MGEHIGALGSRGKCECSQRAEAGATKRHDGTRRHDRARSDGRRDDRTNAEPIPREEPCIDAGSHHPEGRPYRAGSNPKTESPRLPRSKEAKAGQDPAYPRAREAHRDVSRENQPRPVSDPPCRFAIWGIQGGSHGESLAVSFEVVGCQSVSRQRPVHRGKQHREEEPGLGHGRSPQSAHTAVACSQSFVVKESNTALHIDLQVRGLRVLGPSKQEVPTQLHNRTRTRHSTGNRPALGPSRLGSSENRGHCFVPDKWRGEAEPTYKTVWRIHTTAGF